MKRQAMMQAQKEKQQAAGLVKQSLPINFTLYYRLVSYLLLNRLHKYAPYAIFKLKMKLEKWPIEVRSGVHNICAATVCF
jgi:hypothetical protein